MLALSACASHYGAAPPAGEMQSTTAPQVNAHLLVSSQWLSEHLNDPQVVVLQVGQESTAYEQGHIHGARFLPLGAIMTTVNGTLNELPPVAQLDSVFRSLGISNGTRVVVYGPSLAAGRTFFTLDYLGHGDRTALLDGGFQGWRAEGRPVSTERPRIVPGSFTSAARPDRVVDANWVHQHLGDPRYALIDARPAGQFSGAVASDGVPRPGHIPGAGNVFWEETLVSTEVPTLRDAASLRAMFQAAGATPGRSVVAYCRSGLQASFAYFVARYLGYDVRMYDGSFMDWSPRTELPVAR
jgi:thiosulfate/3-mercaptopyruvate sulfurtransferase